MDVTHEEHINAVTKESEKLSVELFNKKLCDLTDEESEYLTSFLKIDAVDNSEWDCD